MFPPKKLLSLFLGFVVLMGCSRSDIQKNYKSQQNSPADFSVFKAFHDCMGCISAASVPHKTEIIQAGKLGEARLVDIPIPLKSNWSDDKENKCSTVFFTELTKEEVISFYRYEMERLGWLEAAFFDDLEPIIIFKKPERWASISVRCYKPSSWRYAKRLRIIIQQT